MTGLMRTKNGSAKELALQEPLVPQIDCTKTGFIVDSSQILDVFTAVRLSLPGLVTEGPVKHKSVEVTKDPFYRREAKLHRQIIQIT